MLWTDQLGRTVEIPTTPQRIISLVPSQTELLHFFGLDGRVVGLTKFCVHPEEWLRTKPNVGGTKRYDIDRIRELGPDLILGNREENDQEQIEILSREFPVWMSDIVNLCDALAMINRVGTIVGSQGAAARLIGAINEGFRELSAERVSKEREPVRAAYFIWRRPYMVAGHSTFVTEMMRLCGLTNVFEQDTSSRYPTVTMEQIRAQNPDVLLLSSEPYPFAEKHLEEFHAMLPRARALLADGEIFSWYGPRLLLAPDYFRALLERCGRPMLGRG